MARGCGLSAAAPGAEAVVGGRRLGAVRFPPWAPRVRPWRRSAYPVAMSAAGAWERAERRTVHAHVADLDRFLPSDSEWRGDMRRMSVSLLELRERFGGDEGVVVDGFAAPHRVSLAPWAAGDPATRLVVWFSYQQRDLPLGFRGSIYPPDVLARAFPAT